MQRIGLLIGLLVAGVVAVAVLALAWAHVSIRAIDPELPGWEAVLAAGAAVPDAERPARLAWVNTARQPVPRSAVLDPGRDPEPGLPYVLAVPAFVLDWPDGRGLLVDVGMEPEEALGFGRLLEWAGAEPLEPLTSLAEALGPALARDWAVVFTHLHVDHTQGIRAMCAGRAADAPALVAHQTRAQAERSNHTTRPARRQLDAATCLERRTLPDRPLAPIPGRPGSFVVRAAGHTPGSQVVVAFLAGDSRPHLFTGDVANHVVGIRSDVPKPGYYRWLVTPESDARLARLRQWLRAAEEQGAVLVVSHDEAQLRGLGLPGPDPSKDRFAPEDLP